MPNAYEHPGDHLVDHLVRLAYVIDRAAGEDVDDALESHDMAMAARVAASRAANMTLPLDVLAQRFGLDFMAVRLLVAAALPGLDVTLAARWQVLVGSAAPERRVHELVDLFTFEMDGGALVDELAALDGLVHFVSSNEWAREAPLLQRVVTVPDRVTGALRGTPTFDRKLAPVATRITNATPRDAIDLSRTPLVVTGPALVGKTTAIAQAAAAAGKHTIVAQLDVIAASGDSVRWLDEVAAEAKILGDVLVLRAGDGIASLPLPLQRLVLALVSRGDAIITTRDANPIIRQLHAPDVIAIDVPDAAAQRALWQLQLACPNAGHARAKVGRTETAPGVSACRTRGVEEREVSSRGREERMSADDTDVIPAIEPAIDLAAVVARCSLPAGEIVEAVASARSKGQLTTAGLIAAARERVQHRLADVASIASTTLGWEDLVVRDDVMQRIFEILAAVHYRDRVLNTWGFADKWPYGRAVTALLCGPPGTGKTMIATLLAKELGLELFRVDLSKVVSKWLGETEKNLGKVFDEAARTGAVVLFDEADALFAKRTEVKSSNDRNANLEVNYLLQRLEAHDGIVLLTTNSANSLDDAFKRRLRFRIELAAPDAAEREALWGSMIPKRAPLAADVDLGALAKRFKMAGGHIKNAVVRAAFLAAQRDVDEIDQQTLMQAASLEWTELGNLLV